MADLIVILILAAVLAAAIIYIVRAKKRGVKCIGCSAADSCGGGCCSCSSGADRLAEEIKNGSDQKKI